MKLHPFFRIFTLSWWAKRPAVKPRKRPAPLKPTNQEMLTMDMISREAVRLWKNHEPFAQKTGEKSLTPPTPRIRIPEDYKIHSHD